MIAPLCHKCKEPINDKFFARINDSSWHDRCVQCKECGSQLTSKCFELDNELLCPQDYVRKKFKTCFQCNGPIFPSEKVLYTNSMTVYHQNCFKCIHCERLLISGDKYYTYFPGSIIICQYDYNNMKQDIIENQNSNEKLSRSDMSMNDDIYQKLTSIISNSRNNSSPKNVEDDLISDVDPSFEETFSSDNDKSYEIRRRTPRTTIKASQLDSLKATFTITPKPSRQMREKLAECTGLSMRVIQVWFQNRRSKERRSKLNIHRKLEKYRFSIRNDINREENISSSCSNSLVMQQTTELQNMHNHLNSTPINFEVMSKVQVESFSDTKYLSSWFVNRSVDLLNN